MKTVFFACMCLAAAVVSAAPKEQKQPARPGGGQAGRVIERLDEVVSGLDLTADQKTQVDAILADLPAQMRELAQQTQDMERRERAQRFTELLRDTRTKIEAELTDAQRAQFADAIDQFRRETQEDRAAGRNQPAPQADNRAPGKENADNAPAGERRQRGQQGPPMVQRLQQALASVELTDEQKPQVRQAMSSLRDKITQIRADAQADPEAARTAAREALAETRRELGQILTQEQRQQLRQAMQADDAERPRRGASREDTPAPPAEMAPAAPPDGPSPPATGPSSDAGSVRPTDSVGLALSGPDDGRSPATTSSSQPLAVGDVAPRFTLDDLDGRQISLETLTKSRPAVVIFGSYTSPAFRDRAPAIGRLRRDLANRAAVVIVYTREAHAQGEWEIERNKDENIAVPPHQSTADRLAAARRAEKALNLAGVPILLDTMNDATFTAYGRHTNAAVVIVAPDGTIAAFQKWFDPYGIRRHFAS